MGELICKKCKAKIKADTFEQADEQIDHSVGVKRGHPCDASDLDLFWNEKPVATVVYHIGPGSKDYKPPVRKQVKKEGSEKDESKKDDSKKESNEDKSESTSSPKKELKNSSTETKN